MDRLVKVASITLGALGLGYFAADQVIYTVPAGHRALIFQRFGANKGVGSEVIGEGAHLLIPYFQEPKIFDVRTNFRAIRSETGSKDLQTIAVTLRLLYRPQVDKLHHIFTKIGPNYDETVLPSIGNEVLKAVMAGFNAEELVTQRENVSALVRQSLVKRAEEFGIILDDVSLTHLAFSREYTQAIETKQVAQQMAERQKFLVEKARHETQAEIILAEGETEAASMIATAMRTGTGFLELRKIEAAKEIAQTLSQAPNITYLPSSGNLLMQLNQTQRPQANSRVRTTAEQQQMQQQLAEQAQALLQFPAQGSLSSE